MWPIVKKLIGALVRGLGMQYWEKKQGIGEDNNDRRN